MKVLKNLQTVNKINKNITSLSLLLFVFMASLSLQSQEHITIDKNGVMKWSSSKEEVTGFGVNYTVPFAHAFRTANRLGIDVKEAIDNDIYHFSRLGFNLYRIHVWDTQISDVEGNLIENEYLDTFDYLLFKLKEKNINYVITPIAFWGNGWPEPDTTTPGFSHKFGKDKCLTEEEAIKAQENYLFQFLNHNNPYTELAYKDDPSVIAFEVSNEPHHRGDAKEVASFVRRMIGAMKKTGTKKPIFYNMSHAVHLADSYFQGGAQGGTFQWYPTGLGYGKELSGNLLPNVDDYNIPFEESFKKFHGAKLVYEFDAADVGRSYIYPAMARSFRKAGIQIATHFAYDPTFMADVNTEYNTHYMNLVYTPQKALSLKISAEVFKEVPMYEDFGHYPQNTTFGNFSVDYKTDLAVYNSETKFYYTNSNNTQLKNKEDLIEIAGYGNSNIINYEGLGAYFLDKIADSQWRLEVMPDAVWVDNPFGRNSPKKTVGAIKWNTHSMKIDLNDLGQRFLVEGINEGNLLKTQAKEGEFNISPGTYMLYKDDLRKNWSASDKFKQNKLSDYFAPKSKLSETRFLHAPVSQTTENTDLKIEVQYIAADTPETLELIGNSGTESIKLELKESQPYHYYGIISHDLMTAGLLNYYIVVKEADGFKSFPANSLGHPYDWDFFDRSTYTVPIVSKTSPVMLFNAADDTENLVRTWRRGLKLIPGWNSNETEYQIHLDKLFVPDAENKNATPIYDYSFKHFVLGRIKQRTADLEAKKKLVLKGRSLTKTITKIQIALVMSDGSSYGQTLILQPGETSEHQIILEDLRPVKTVLLPRPYPTFLPYFFESKAANPFSIQDVESIQFSIGPGLDNQQIFGPVAIGITSLWLE